MISELNIQTGLRQNSTYLENSYCTPPFKLADIREDKRDPCLKLMLMSSSPGIFDGDEYQINIDVAAGCSLELQTQSYQRLFNMKHGAVQQTEVNIAENASFCYIPQPCVPHAGAIFASKNLLNLRASSTLQWGEVLTCGRKLNGEEFLFEKYHSRTDIFIDRKLIVKENLLIRPSHINVHAIGQMEGYTHQASFICIGNFAKDQMACLNGYLKDIEEIEWGISALQQHGFVLRILGKKAEQLYAILKKAVDITLAKSKQVYAG